MSGKVEVKKKTDANTFYQSGKIKVGGKEVNLPVKSLELSKLSPKINIDERFRGQRNLQDISTSN